jgi:hypothetical protein
MNKQLLKELTKKLEGLKWCFLSGTALSVYSHNKRVMGDIDILLSNKKDLDIFAKRINCKAEKREIKKGEFLLKDCGFETNFSGVSLDVVTNFPNNSIQINIIKKIFGNLEKRYFLGQQIFLVPIEGLIVQKATMGRDKDFKDLELLKNFAFNKKLIKEFLNLWGNKEKPVHLLKKIGYKI